MSLAIVASQPQVHTNWGWADVDNPVREPAASNGASPATMNYWVVVVALFSKRALKIRLSSDNGPYNTTCPLFK